MAGCLNFVEGGNISPENIKIWTENLSNVLLSPTARRRFCDYLETRDMEEGERLLEFWEQCDLFMNNAKKRHRHNHEKRQNQKESTCSSGNGTEYRRQHNEWNLVEEAKEIMQFAELEINFDTELIPLYEAIDSEDSERIVTAISDVKQCAAEKLEQAGYEQFCSFLIENQRLPTNN